MKLTFSEALEAINDQRGISRGEVRADALRRIIWVAEWHLPGCISESFSVFLTKGDAIDCACSMAESEDGAPRGMRTALRKFGRFDSRSPMFGTCINTIERRTLADLF